MPKSMNIVPEELKRSGQISFKDIPVNQYDVDWQSKRQEIGDENLLRIYRDMTIIREFEFMLSQIKTQGLYNEVAASYGGPAHLSLGQEAAYVGQAYYLDREDLCFGSHRSHGEILAKSLSCIEKLSDEELTKIMENFMEGTILKTLNQVYKATSLKDLAIHFILYGTLAEILARKTGFHRGLGGSMHAFFPDFGVYPNNAIVGGSATIAVGGALYKKVNKQAGIVVCNIGDGSLGCGPVWEALNFAAMDQFNSLWEDNPGGLPILFNIFNNGYGMGGQTRGETMAYDFLARIGAGVSPSQMHAERVWGHDPLAVMDAVKRKKALLNDKQGPVLLDVVTYRLTGHSPSDQNAYRSKEEIDEWTKVDPCVTFKEELLAAGVATNAYFDKLWEETRERMSKVCKWAADKELSPYIDLKSDNSLIEQVMFSNQTIVSCGQAEPLTLLAKEECSRVKQIAGKERSAFKDGQAVSTLKVFNIRDAVFEPLLDKFYEDSSLIAYGEDVREWGGAFAVYRGLAEVLPHSRLFNAPISEAAIVGSAVGYGLCGGRAVVELMYSDFIGRAGDEIFNQLSKWQAMSAGLLKMPIVLRISVGCKYGAQHSQDWTSLCAHIPGLKVCFPATPYEAKGLMQKALNGSDPVVFFESQKIYDVGEMFREGGVPRENYELEIGDTNLIQSGSDLTILTIGAALYTAVEAAKKLAEDYGVKAEIINLPSITPLNYEQIIASIKKTGKVLLTSEACMRGSILNDIAQHITELCFDDLDGPPIVVGARNWITPPYEFEDDFFPQADWLVDAIAEDILPLGKERNRTAPTKVEKIRRLKYGV